MTDDRAVLSPLEVPLTRTRQHGLSLDSNWKHTPTTTTEHNQEGEGGASHRTALSKAAGLSTTELGQ
jgi:hypothetical protein